MKLSTVQKRAKAYCDLINRFGKTTINVEWKKSAMYGLNPVIKSNDGKCTSVSGCGYDKLSQALADVLCFLMPVDSNAFQVIASTGGCGVNAVESKLAEYGYKLCRTASGKTFDGFTIGRVIAAE
jgi:hypothetical protein